MTSVVYYKFKSQKEPSKISFDGTGISVFDLKKEILLASKLAPIAETLDLQVINPDTKEEYNDDTEIIPRSMSVIARRLPAARPNHSAARYVSGSMPSGGAVKNAGRREDQRFANAGSNNNNHNNDKAPVALPNNGGTEEDMISAMFDAQEGKWKQTQEAMANATPIYFSSAGKPSNMPPVPDYPPPPTYTCHRCGLRGHWIQACPTINDPNWDGKRVKRTTGIPRTMMRTVEKPADDAVGTYMINEDGQYVELVADSKSWKSYQDKAKALQMKSEKPTDPELICPLTKKLFDKPVKTPCCSKTYSEDAIQQALLDSDFVCPNCGHEEVLLDQLVPDKDMEERVKKWKQEIEEADKPEEDDKVEADKSGDSRANTSEPVDDKEKEGDKENADSEAFPDGKEQEGADSGGNSSSSSRKRSRESDDEAGNEKLNPEKKAKEEGSKADDSKSDKSKSPEAEKKEEEADKHSKEPEKPAPAPYDMPFPPFPMPGMPGMPPFMMPPFMMPGMMPPLPGMPPFMMPPFNMNQNQNQNQNQKVQSNGNTNGTTSNNNSATNSNTNGQSQKAPAQNNMNKH